MSKIKPKPRAAGPAPIQTGPSTETLLNAIREHRATHTPSAWRPADRALYANLPEVAGN